MLAPLLCLITSIKRTYIYIISFHVICVRGTMSAMSSRNIIRDRCIQLRFCNSLLRTGNRINIQSLAP